MTTKASQLAAFVSAANVTSTADVATFNANVAFSNSAIEANGTIGTAGQVLASTGNGAMYWTDMSSGNSNFTGSYNNLTDKPDILSPFLLMGA